MKDDDYPRLPVKIDSTSNGEYRPLILGPTLQRANELAVQRLSDNARRSGLNRRHFLNSLCGVATTLATFNTAFAARSNLGGSFDLPAEAPLDQAAAASSLAGDEFIFDVQTHMIENTGAWRQKPRSRGWERILKWWPQGSCGESDPVDCYSAEHYIKEVFYDSDTTMAVMSFVPAPMDRNPLSLEEASRTRDLVNALGDGRRLLLHAMVLPNLPPLEKQLDGMEQAAANWNIAAWKCYTQWGPLGTGWALDDPKVGIPFIEKARALGIRNICIHKGLTFSNLSPKFTDCADVGRAAKLFPDVNFIIYHSGLETDTREGAYDPANAARGVNTLIKSMQDNGIAPNSNVYAELGSTWRILMRDPTAAAHTLGKLMKYVGQDRLLWGTDSIWYGSPQDQIQAFRAFKISNELQDKYNYPALDAVQKQKVFGLNAASVYGVDVDAIKRKTELDPVGATKAEYLETPNPSHQTYGPRNAREFDLLQRAKGGWPD